MRALIDHHLHLDSPLHRWHPTCKLLGTAALAIAVAAVDSLPVAALCAVLALGVAALGRLPARLLWSRMASFAGFLILLAVLLGLSMSPRDLSVGGIGLSAAGLHLGGLIGLKCLAIVALSVASLATTATVQIFSAARRLGLPARLVEIALLAYRLVFSVSEEMECLRRAASCRGFRGRATVRHLRTLGRLTGALLGRSLKRSERLYDAMLARGYDGTVRALAAPRAQVSDHLKLALSISAAAALLVGRWW